MATTEKETVLLYNGEVEVDYYPNSHQYKLKRDGKKVLKKPENQLSVTNILGIIEKPMLRQWAVNRACDLLLRKVVEGVAITIECIEEARFEHVRFAKQEADLGTLVHCWAEAYIIAKVNNSQAPELPEDERVLNGVLAFLRWVKEHNVQFVSCERLVYSRKHKYVGRMDAEAIIDGRKRVVDFKTSNGIWTEHRYQTVAYQRAAEEEGSVYEGPRVIARFQKDDKYDKEGKLIMKAGDFEAMEFNDEAKDFKTFLSALVIRKREKELSFNRF
jgi:hypothetical protein